MILALLVIAISSVALGLASAPSLQAITSELLRVALISTLLGSLLAAPRLPAWVGLPAGLGLGTASAFVAGGRLGDSLQNWLSKLPPLLSQFAHSWRWCETQSGRFPEICRQSLDWQPITIAWQLLSTDAGKVWQRLITWGVNIWRGKPATDVLPLAIFWMCVLWLLAFWAGWATWRTRNPLIALGPAVGLLAVLLNYQGLNARTLIAPLGATLLLIALMRYDSREHRWVQQRIDFAEGIPLDLMLTAGALVAVLLTLGLLLPSFSVQAVTDIFRSFNRSDNSATVGKAFGLQPKEPPPAPRKARPAGLASYHNLGGGPHLTEDVVMIVEVSQPYYSPPPVYMPAMGEIPSPPRYYWRMQTYDQYTGSGWRSSATTTVFYNAETVIFPEIPASQQTIVQTITPVQGLGGVLFATGQIQSANQPYEASWRLAPGAFTQADLFGALIRDGVYKATSYLPQVTAAQLRVAPTTYPPEIGSRYLQLPETLPIRVRQLALELTTEQPTPYDKAIAIEQFLRTIPYSLEIAAPPNGRDSVDYFLFDLQTGFCDYYASAMTVLARAAGLPARPVMGYASGSFDLINGRYMVRELDAHTWVEIYFPEIGWVEFEPTAAQPAIVRPDDDGRPVVLPHVKLPEPEIQPAPSLAARLKGYVSLTLLSLACLGALLVQGSFVVRAVEMWWWSRQPPKQAIIAIYERMWRSGRRILGPLSGGYTPNEFSGRLQINLETIARPIRSRGFSRLKRSSLVREPVEADVFPAKASTPEAQPTWFARRLTPAGEEIRQLTQWYVQAVYSEHPITREVQIAALQTWRKLRGHLWLARLAHQIRRLSPKGKKSA
jgi:transglutaminase-like putative cysteine protease